MKIKSGTVALGTAFAVLATLAAGTASLEQREVWTNTLNFHGERETIPCLVTALGDWKFDAEGKPWRVVQVAFAGGSTGNIQSVSHTKLFHDAACTQPLDVGPAPESRMQVDPSQSSAPSNAFNPGILRGASWVIREIDTQKPVLETYEPRVVLALNTSKYEAWPIAAHLASYSRKA